MTFEERMKATIGHLIVTVEQKSALLETQQQQIAELRAEVERLKKEKTDGTEPLR